MVLRASPFPRVFRAFSLQRLHGLSSGHLHCIVCCVDVFVEQDLYSCIGADQEFLARIQLGGVQRLGDFHAPLYSVCTLSRAPLAYLLNLSLLLLQRNVDDVHGVLGV
jgi:hypothetical protein